MFFWNFVAAASGGPWEGYVCCAVDAVSVAMDAVVLLVVIEPPTAERSSWASNVELQPIQPIEPGYVFLNSHLRRVPDGLTCVL
jgi:hypothetical protein